MTTPIRAYLEANRERIARRREQADTKGLGYWAAIDAIRIIEKLRAKEAK